MGLPDLYPAQVGSPYTTLAAPYTTGEATMSIVDATKLPDAPNIVCLAGSVAGEFRYTGKDGNTLLGVVKLPGTPNATWPAGTFAFRGIAAYDHASIVEHLTFQRSHIVEATLDLTANRTYSGRVLEGAEAGENLAFGDLAVLAESGKFVKANPATLATLDGTIALVVSDTIAAGSQGMFLLRGLIRNDSWTFSPGKELYAGNGTLTHEPPAVGTQLIRKMGTALSSTIIEFAPSSTIHAEHLISVLPVTAVTKDNNDIERKFWKDTCDQNNTGQYTMITGTFPTVDTDHYVFNAAKEFRTTVAPPQIEGVYRIAVQFIGDDAAREVVIKPGENSYVAVRKTATNDYELALKLMGVGMWTKKQSSGQITWDTVNPNIVELIVTATTIEVYLNGVSKGGVLRATYPIETTAKFQIYGTGTVAAPTELYEVAYLPPKSYSDDFTSDTVTDGRYQAVTGTVAYDDVNKRMTITAGAGVTAKTRLKSYTQLEGAYKRKLHLPATGTDGDVVAAYFGTEPTLESGFGIGAIRTAGAWNIATINGATVTDTGTVIADLVDGDSFYVEVERDTTHGVVWYYVYKSGKPTTASGKLFNTYQEIYDGFWFKNNGAAENSIAVSEIEDRAESIVGRTNVELTEEVFNSITGQMETRTYFKPIHRGAMLETYHDGTQEVVGTTFIDDCQWDRSAEYNLVNTTSFTFDTVNGVIVETETSDNRSDQLKIKTRFGSAHYHYKFTKIADARYIGAFTFCDQRETSHTCPIDNATSCSDAELYFVNVNSTSPETYLQVYRRTVGSRTKIGETAIPTISDGETHTIDILHNAGSGNIRVFYDGIQKINITDTTYTSGYCGPTLIYSSSTGTKFSEIQIIAASPDATNGIAACIPPIGGGARYGVEESVYIPITPGTEIPVGSAVISPNAKSTVVGTALTTFAQTPAGVSASIEYATGTKACPGLSTAFAPVGRHRVKADRNTLTNIGVKGSVAGTSPTVYIDSLHVRKQEVA